MQRKIIGITGGIGSGKTTVSQIITSKGFPVYNSDNRAKEIVNDNQDIQQKIIYLLGEKAYENGVYNRSFVANCVFNNNELLQKLNEIIHPAVRQDFLDFMDRQNSQFIFKETAILFELGLDKDCDVLLHRNPCNVRSQVRLPLRFLLANFLSHYRGAVHSLSTHVLGTLFVSGTYDWYRRNLWQEEKISQLHSLWLFG